MVVVPCTSIFACGFSCILSLRELPDFFVIQSTMQTEETSECSFKKGSTVLIASRSNESLLFGDSI
jgi:hypothetical protein